MSLSAETLAITQSYVGTRETSHNSGDDVDIFLASVGLAPGNPWCYAFLYHCVAKAAARLGLDNPIPRTGSTQRAWRTAQPYMRWPNPAPGLIYIIQHSETTGHAGIVEFVDEDGDITEISGNSNRTGSREGDSVVRKIGQPEVVHGGVLLGYLDLDRGAQATS